MGKNKINLQMFANIDDIVQNHAENLKDVDIKGSFDIVSTKLSELGYDVLINQKEKAEFVPAARLSEVVSQRDSFKQKVEALNAQLLELQNIKGNSDELNAKIETLMNTNKTLLAELEQSNFINAIMAAAKDAHDPKALLPFVKKDNVKTTTDGSYIGIDAEIERLKAEMPYLFVDATTKKKKAGFDASGTDADSKKLSMNAMIRKASGRTF